MFKTNHLKNLNKLITNKFNSATSFKLPSQMSRIQLSKFSEYQQDQDNQTRDLNENEELNRDLLTISKQEKIFSKVLLRNIRFYSKGNLTSSESKAEEEQNDLYNSVSSKLIKTFNFAEEDEEFSTASRGAGESSHFLLDENNNEANLIYSTPKSFYVEWINSDLSEGKFAIRIKSQSKNIIFEDLFNFLQNIKDENSLFVVNNFDSNADEDQSSPFGSKANRDADELDLLSDSEDLINHSKLSLDFPKELLEESSKDRRKFDLIYEFDVTKPNQLLFFCEKLFVNDIISAEELSEIKKLPFVSNRNLKYSQDQSMIENQYDSVTEALADIRTMQKLERLHEAADVKATFELNLLHWRPDHKIDAKFKLPKSVENRFIYVISDKENLEFLSKVPGITKLDCGEFFEDFVHMIDKDTYNKKYKLFIAKNNLEIITENGEIYDRFVEKAPGFQNHIRNNEEEIVSEVTDVQENNISIKLSKNNKIEANIGDLTLKDESLAENLMFLKKQILKLKPQTVNKKNYIRNLSLFVNNVEFRLKNKE